MTSISSITSSVNSSSGSAGSSSLALSEDFTAFLTLLTTQLKNQDPLEPMDSAEFTNQLVQFANVEQAIASNQHLENLSALGLASLNSGLVNYIGRTIEMEYDQFELQENGSFTFKYTLPQEANSVKVIIQDSEGDPVHSFDVDGLTAGDHMVTWDGKDENGIPLDPGVYKVQVVAKNVDGEEIEDTIHTFGVVTAIGMEDGTPVMELGDKISVSPDTIIRISVTPETTSQEG